MAQSGARSLLWLGEPGAMEYTESESLELWHFVPGDTFLNRHAYFPEGERPFLKAAAEELETEVGPERSCRGSQRLAIGGRPPFDQRTAKAGFADLIQFQFNSFCIAHYYTLSSECFNLYISLTFDLTSDQEKLPRNRKNP